MFDALVSEHSVPEAHRFAVKHRLRTALIHGSGDLESIEKMHGIRLLSVAIWGT